MPIYNCLKCTKQVRVRVRLRFLPQLLQLTKINRVSHLLQLWIKVNKQEFNINQTCH